MFCDFGMDLTRITTHSFQRTTRCHAYLSVISDPHLCSSCSRMAPQEFSLRQMRHACRFGQGRTPCLCSCIIHVTSGAGDADQSLRFSTSLRQDLLKPKRRASGTLIPFPLPPGRRDNMSPTPAPGSAGCPALPLLLHHPFRRAIRRLFLNRPVTCRAALPKTSMIWSATG